MTSEITRTVAQRHTINPRTVLGFYATTLAIIFTGCCGVTLTLATTDTVTWIIPWILGFCGILIISTLAAIVYINVKRPANLMLGQITGTEYAEINRHTVLGSDTKGERTVYIPSGKTTMIDPVEPPSGDVFAQSGGEVRE